MAEFDRSVPPGGEGKVVLKVSLSGYQGRVHKGAVVYTNDPDHPKIRLAITGKVVPIIAVKPRSVVFFRGAASKLEPQVLDLVSEREPFHITKVESTLEGKIAVQLETVEKGKHYRLHIANVTDQGSYFGVVTCFTDDPKKPKVRIKVRGIVEGMIGVRPRSILLGRLSPKMAPRSGQVLVISNAKQPFKITRLDYDRKLLKVKVDPMEKKPGYRLTVIPVMDHVPKPGQKRTTMTIETDAEAGHPMSVGVFIINR